MQWQCGRWWKLFSCGSAAALGNSGDDQHGAPNFGDRDGDGNGNFGAMAMIILVQWQQSAPDPQCLIYMELLWEVGAQTSRHLISFRLPAYLAALCF